MPSPVTPLGMATTKRGGPLKNTVDSYLRRSYRNESPPHVSELALQLRLSRWTLNKQFRALTGTSLGRHLKERRMECAKRLLFSTNWNVCTIARRAAFSSVRSFRRAFMQHTGMTPSEFRRSRSSH